MSHRVRIIGSLMFAIGVAAAADAPGPGIPEAAYQTWITSESAENLTAVGHDGFQNEQFRLMDYHYVRYQSERGALYDPGLGVEDYTATRIAAIRAAGMEPNGYIVPYRSAIAEQHPEWRMLDWNGNPVDDHGPCLDFMSPWGDELRERLVEVVKKYPLNHIWLDGFTYQWHGGAKGESAIARFKKDTGLDMPAKWDLQDMAVRRWLAWRGEVLAEYSTKLQTTLRRVRPEIYCTYNSLRYMMWPSWQAWGYEAQERASDVACAEYSWYVGKDPVHKRMMMARLRGVRGDKPAMTWLVPGIENDFPPAPLAETLSRVYTCLTQRVGIGMYAAQLQKAQGPTIVKAIKDRIPFLVRAQDVRYAGLVVQERDDWFYDLTKRSTDYRQNYEGVFRMLCEMHVPTDVLTEPDLTLESLKRYAVIILPGQHCLSEASAKALREYVAGGGGVIATDQSSRFTEWAEPRSDFALADLFGCKYIDDGESAVKDQARIMEVDGRQPIFSGPEFSDCLLNRVYDSGSRSDFVGSITVDRKIPPYDQDVLSLAQTPWRFTRTEPTSGKAIAWLLDDQRQRTLPAAYLNQSGRGKVVYFPCDLGAMYAATSYPQWRLMFAQACKLVSTSKPVIEGIAPQAIQCEPTYQPAEQRYVVHLLNDHLQSLCALDQPIRVRQDLPLIAGIRVRVRKPLTVRQAFLEPGHIALKIESAEDGSDIVVPPLADHAMVVFPGR